MNAPDDTATRDLRVGTRGPMLPAKAAVAGLALLAPVRSFDQLLYALAFALALLAFWLWGRAFGRAVLGLALRPFNAICLGQLAALAAATVATAANSALSRLAGRSLPLRLLVPAASLWWLFRELRRKRPAQARSWDPFTPFALGCCAVVLAIYSRHLSALGLDTHEHTAWVEQILRLGRVPLAEPGTAILADYPRTFHLLAALWSAAGLGLPAGPLVKLMPFLQNALPMLAAAESLEDAAAQGGGEHLRGRFRAALAAGFFVYAFLLVPLAYPWGDLSGTARYSSAAVVLAPAVLLLLGAVHRAPRATSAALGSLPLLGAWALTMNPVLPLVLATVSLPVSAVLWLFLRPPLAGGVRFAVAAAALGAAVVAQDPWAVSQAAKRSTACAAVLEGAGIVPFDEAVLRGIATPREKSVKNAPPGPGCRDKKCAAQLAWGAVKRAAGLPWRAAEAAIAGLRALRPSLAALRHAFEGAIPLQPAAFADYAALPYLALVAAAALVAGVRSFRRRREGLVSPERFLAASLAATALAGLGLALAAALATAFDDGAHESVMLDYYLHNAAHHVSLSLLWFPFAAACLVLAGSLRKFEKGALPELRLAALSLWVLLPLAARLNLNVPIRAAGFGGPIHLADVRALHELESRIPPDDGVLVPAEHWKVNDFEHWVIPVGPATALLPYGQRRYLFDVYLGASYPLSWRDLEDRLCSPDPAVRRAFLERQRVRWLLVRDQAGLDAESALREQKLCGQLLTSFVSRPAVRNQRGIGLFRLGPPADSP